METFVARYRPAITAVFPFNIQSCLNGREWLARQFERKRHTDFERDDNCFTHLGDPALAQRLMDRPLRTGWQRALDALARTLNPLHTQIFTSWPQTYYWSADQNEWATALLFRHRPALATLYPTWVRHATLHFQSPDVMRFLGRKGVHGRFTGEAVSSYTRRPEGVRVKHRRSTATPSSRTTRRTAFYASRPPAPKPRPLRCAGPAPTRAAAPWPGNHCARGLPISTGSRQACLRNHLQ